MTLVTPPHNLSTAVGYGLSLCGVFSGLPATHVEPFSNKLHKWVPGDLSGVRVFLCVVAKKEIPIDQGKWVCGTAAKSLSCV